MKRILSISILSFLMLTLVSYARTTYNPDNTIKYTNTIRSQREARIQRDTDRERAHQAAAAAKINYEEFDKANTNKNNTNKK